MAQKEKPTKIKSFTDLIAWQQGHTLVLMIYKAVKKFPPDERFGLTSQLQRAVVSITSNIAEGFSRNSNKEKVLFFNRSLASLTEVQNQILIARDLTYLPRSLFSEIANQTILVNKLLSGLCKSVDKLSR